MIGESCILADHHGEVTFRYTDGKSGERRTETLPGEDFLWRVIQHVLPRGFHRVRDYGFLHHNARKTLQLIQLILQVALKPMIPKERPCFCCAACGGQMKVIMIYPPDPGESFTLPAQGPPREVPA